MASSKLSRSGYQRFEVPSFARLLIEPSARLGSRHLAMTRATSTAASPGSASKRYSTHPSASSTTRSNTIVRTPWGSPTSAAIARWTRSHWIRRVEAAPPQTTPSSVGRASLSSSTRYRRSDGSGACWVGSFIQNRGSMWTRVESASGERRLRGQNSIPSNR